MPHSTAFSLPSIYLTRRMLRRFALSSTAPKAQTRRNCCCLPFTCSPERVSFSWAREADTRLANAHQHAGWLGGARPLPEQTCAGILFSFQAQSQPHSRVMHSSPLCLRVLWRSSGVFFRRRTNSVRGASEGRRSPFTIWAYMGSREGKPWFRLGKERRKQ